MPEPSRSGDERVAENLIRIYDRATELIIEEIRVYGLEGQSGGRSRRLLGQLDQIVSRLTGETRDLLTPIVESSYEVGSEYAIEEMRRRLGMGPDQVETSFGQIDQAAIDAIATRTFGDFQTVLQSLTRDVRSLVLDTQTLPTLNQDIRDRVGAAIAAGQTRRELSGDLRRILRESQFPAELIQRYSDLLDGARIRVGGKAIRLDDYAKLVARTMTRDAVSRGVERRTVANDLDLLEITGRRGVIDSCLIFEGLLVSVTGRTEGVPTVRQLPRGGTPFHPNCRHNQAPRSIEFMDDAEFDRKTKIRKRYLGRTWSELERIRRREFGGDAFRMRRHARGSAA